MKSMLAISLLSIFSFMTFGCAQKYVVEDAKIQEDGVYRGVFIDGDSIQVNVEFELEDGVVKEASFRHLRRDDDYHLTAEEEPYRSVIKQYKEALEHLVGKDLEAHLKDLYEPENIVETDVDGYTSATLRSNKIVSAIRDALNRGVYSYP